MEYAALLALHDHPILWEYSLDFTHDTATARFAKFVEELSAALGTSLRSETGSYIQDASFHSQVFLPLSDDHCAVVRFSNFGDMVAVDDEEPIPDTTIKQVTELLAKHDYTWVPAAVLHAPYTGVNPGVTGISSWWIRYFDYV
jgi:hypothetical protein